MSSVIMSLLLFKSHACGGNLKWCEFVKKIHRAWGFGSCGFTHSSYIEVRFQMNPKFLKKTWYCCQYLHSIECKLLLSLMITKEALCISKHSLHTICLMALSTFQRAAFMLCELEHTELKGWFYKIVALVKWKQTILVSLKK